MSIEVLSGKVFLLITGASRGIGREIAIRFGSLLQEGSHMLLLARNLDALQEVAKNISSMVTVDTVNMDLGTISKDDLEETILQSLKRTTRLTFERVVVVHNVGSIGDVSKFVNDMVDVRIWREYYDLNVFMPAVLNAVIMKIFDINIKKVIINLTSIFAIKANCGLGYYCSAKAAREMYFKVFALENPNVDVLNYSPGPVDTNMFLTGCKHIIDPDTNKKFNELRTTNTVLTVEQTVNRLVQVLQEHKYKSADHVDYYDE